MSQLRSQVRVTAERTILGSLGEQHNLQPRVLLEASVILVKRIENDSIAHAPGYRGRVDQRDVH